MDMSSDSAEDMTIVKTSDVVSSDDSSGNVKMCTDCGTTKTPLWRGGPAGPKSLCNACGIRARKKKRALLGLSKNSTEKKKAAAAVKNGGVEKTAAKKVRVKKMGEVEQAAILLMALSGSVYV